MARRFKRHHHNRAWFLNWFFFVVVVPWLCGVFPSVVSAGDTDATPSDIPISIPATIPAIKVLGYDTKWWLERVHLNEDFVFDGTKSDYGLQFYRRFLAGDSMATMTGQLDVPSAVHDRIADAQAAISPTTSPETYETTTTTPATTATAASPPLRFADLSPLLQRALLWDTGIVRAGDLSFTQVFTRCGLRMAQLALTQDQYEATGCVAQPCSTANGQLYAQSVLCNGYQIGNGSLCAAAKGKSPVHASMWSTGGDDWTMPDTELLKHEWDEQVNANETVQYRIYAIHLVGDPNSYGRCVAPSMTVPCIAYEQLSLRDQAAWCEPQPSRLVTQWIRAERELAALRAETRHHKWVYQTAVIAVSAVTLVVLLAAVWWYCWWRSKADQRKQRDEDELERSRKTGNGGAEGGDPEAATAAAGGDPAAALEAGALSYFFTDETTGRRLRRQQRGMGQDPQAAAVLGASGGIGVWVSSFHSKLVAASKRVLVASSSSSASAAFADDSFQHNHHQPREEDYEGISTRRGGGAVVDNDGLIQFESEFSSPPLATGEDSNHRDGGVSARAAGRRGVAFADDHVSHSLSKDQQLKLTHTGATSVLTSATYATAVSFSSDSSSSSSSPRPCPPKRRETTPLQALLHDPLVMSKRVPFIDVSISRCLSKGAYGEVWIGRMRDQLVAVKRLIHERRTSVKDLALFTAEIKLMVQFEHRNVLSLLGVAWNTPENLCIMMEYADRGDLQHLLKSHTREQLPWYDDTTHATESCGNTSFLSVSHSQLPSNSNRQENQKIQIAIDIACGLQYLHTRAPAVVHRDLKSNNVLLSENLVAKLCDFGVSRVNEGLETMTCGVGTACWTAPEVLVGDKYTQTADVYSFGVVLTEMDTHLLPFHDAVDDATTTGCGQRKMEMMRIMHLVCLGELAPSLTVDCPLEIQKLARDCLQLDPLKRPTTDEIILRLQMLLWAHGGDNTTSSFCLPDDPEEESSSRRMRRLRNSSDGSGFSVQDGDDDNPVGGEGGDQEEGMASTRRRGMLAMEAAEMALENVSTERARVLTLRTDPGPRRVGRGGTKGGRANSMDSDASWV